MPEAPIQALRRRGYLGSLKLDQCSFMLPVCALIATKFTMNRVARSADQPRSATSAVGFRRLNGGNVRDR